MGFISLKPKPVEISTIVSRTASQTINKDIETVNEESG
jgi:hypothetical protein